MPVLPGDSSLTDPLCAHLVQDLKSVTFMTEATTVTRILFQLVILREYLGRAPSDDDQIFDLVLKPQLDQIESGEFDTTAQLSDNAYLHTDEEMALLTPPEQWDEIILAELELRPAKLLYADDEDTVMVTSAPPVSRIQRRLTDAERALGACAKGSGTLLKLYIEGSRVMFTTSAPLPPDAELVKILPDADGKPYQWKPSISKGLCRIPVDSMNCSLHSHSVPSLVHLHYGRPDIAHEQPDDSAHGQLDVVHGQPDIVHGQQDIAHGQPDGTAHGQLDDIAHGQQGDAAHGQSDVAHGRPNTRADGRIGTDAGRWESTDAGGQESVNTNFEGQKSAERQENVEAKGKGSMDAGGQRNTHKRHPASPESRVDEGLQYAERERGIRANAHSENMERKRKVAGQQNVGDAYRRDEKTGRLIKVPVDPAPEGLRRSKRFRTV
ncbi:hypothetical protein PUNSTDRAFT_133727 [Punctularia strigosozonata HHB-11173 SS5]|uniref:uncharacterized protein n=1 Tax=Punctularia strigosozonata (strain HHB-11173) TaxID=741275 RepID=UPI0004416A87|nr:uncharacterized protein PUNSTDRAFT_133727 [Punctularia strigosozonata HHB-11173 SS5]EIN09956.1 hypothetical protein PUNSTDRAFT_133727 [Punctularia strigosozonata HHB-11173 SS5]